MGKIKDLLPYFETLISASEKLREKIKEHIIEEFRQNRRSKKAHEVYLSDFLSKECEFKGFTPNIQYTPGSKSQGFPLDCLAVHPFGAPTAVFYWKKGGMVLLVNPYHRWDGNVLEEIGQVDDQVIREIKNARGASS